MLTQLSNLASLMPSLGRAEVAYRDLVDGHLPPGFAALKRECAALPLGSHEGTKKFLNSSWYLRESLARAIRLGLDRQASRSVLDLGCGAGYFLLACRYYGHDVCGFDLPDNPFYNRFVAGLGIPRIDGRIEAFQAPALPNRTFDLITAFSITFDTKTTKWRVPEWHFLTGALRSKLSPNGRLCFRLNRERTEGRAPLQEFFGGCEGFDCRVLDYRSVLLTRTG